MAEGEDVCLSVQVGHGLQLHSLWEARHGLQLHSLWEARHGLQLHSRCRRTASCSCRLTWRVPAGLPQNAGQKVWLMNPLATAARASRPRALPFCWRPLSV